MSIRNNIGELLLKPIISVLIGHDQLQFYETTSGIKPIRKGLGQMA